MGGGLMARIYVPRGMYYRRGSPENIVAVGAASRSVSAGVDTWGVYAANVASLGANSILAAVSIAGRVVVSVTVNGTSTTRQRIWLDVATGAAASEVPFSRTEFGVANLTTLSGKVLDAPTASAQTTMLEQAVLPFRYIPSGTRIATRGYQTGDASNTGKRLYLVLYDLSLESCLSRWPVNDVGFVEGIGNHSGDDTPDTAETTLTQSATPWTFGAYVSVIASLADNYLITGVSASYELNNDLQLDFALGATGSEIIHARAAVPTGLGVVLPWSMGRSFQFPVPWLAYKGEQISARAAGGNSAASSIPIRLEGIRLGNSGAIS